MWTALKTWLRDDIKLGRFWWVPIVFFPVGLILGAFWIAMQFTLWNSQRKLTEAEQRAIEEREKATQGQLDANERERANVADMADKQRDLEKERNEAEANAREAEIEADKTKEKQRIAGSDDAADDAVDDLLS